MLTARSLIENAGLTALAKDLTEIAGRPCSAQNIVYWRKMDAVPGKWLPAVLAYLRRQGTEPTADDVVALTGGPTADLKGICKEPDPQDEIGAKATPRAAAQQLNRASP